MSQQSHAARTGSAPPTATSDETRPSLDDLTVKPGWPSAASPLVAECVDARHPTLTGRVLCRVVSDGGDAVERWVPTLLGLAIREGDRVLVTQAANHAEPIVLGVLDGFTPRPAKAAKAAATRALLPDEVVRFESPAGEPLVEIGPGEHGPVVRILSRELDVELPGRLRVRAGDIELRADRGSVKIAASDDVVVQGEAIRLN